MPCVKRREFITLLGGAVATWPLAAGAEQRERVRRIGFLSVSPRATVSRVYAGLVQGMHELGYVEGKDFVTEWRSGEGAYERLPDLAAEFVRLKVDVIVTGVAGALRVLQQATATIPIVAAYSTDPVGNGLVASLAHPGATPDWFSSSDDTSPKQLELLITVAPGTSRVGFSAIRIVQPILPFLTVHRTPAGRSIFPSSR